HCATLTIFFFSNATAPPDIYSLSLHDALPIWRRILGERAAARRAVHGGRVRVLLSSHRARRRAAHLDRDLPDPALRRDLGVADRSEEHTSELQSLRHLVCRLLLEKKKRQTHQT